jgi:hydrogenase nickel incorporation protein HypA/HybF
MHELSLIQSMLEIALESAQAQGAKQIHQLNMQIGAIAGVVPEAIEFAFDVCTQHTIAAGAKLEITWLPVLCHCQTCDCDFKPAEAIYVCPKCGSISAQILQGRELNLTSLEVS